MKHLKRFFVFLCILGVLGGGAFVWYRISRNSPESLRLRADENYEAGQYEEALLEYRMLLSKDPQNAHAYRRAGMIWMERGAPLRAIPFLQQSLRLEPDDVPTRNKWARVLLGLGDSKGVRREALGILDLAPGDKEAILLLANTSFNEEQITETRKRLEAFDAETDTAYHLASAVLLAREGKAEELKASLQRAEQIDPKALDVQLALANYHRASGDSEQYLATLQQASERAEPRSIDRLRYAQALAGEKRFDEAMRELEEITATVDDYLPAYRMIADLQANEGKYDEALQTLRKILRVDPVNLEANSIEARIHLAKGDPAEAVAVFRKLDTAYPKAPRIKFGLASYYLRNGEEAKARMTLEAAMKAAPELSREHAEAITLLANLELRSGNPAGAAKWLEPLVAGRPELRQVQLLLARAYAAEGRLEDAANLFRTLIEKQPESPLGHFMLGQILKLQKRPEEAIRSLETARKLAPDDQTIVAELVGLDLVGKDYATAHARVQPLLNTKDADWGGWYLEGSIFSAEEKWPEAETALQKSLDLKPGSLSVYNLLIDNYLRSGDPSKAIAQLEDLIEEQPESIQHRMLLGLLLEQQSEFEHAAVIYRKLLDDNPKFVPALNNLAYLYVVRLENLPEAEKIARSARELAKEDPSVADTLGWTLVRLGGETKMREGLSLLKEAAASLPDQPEVQYHLGVALSRAGAREDSRRALEHALASGSDFPGKEEVGKLLAAFGGANATGQNLTDLEAQRKAAPFNLPVRLQLGQLYRAKGETKLAIAVYEEALELDTKNLGALKALAQIQQADRPAQARSYALLAWEADPSDPETAALQGHWVLQDGLFAQAYTLLKPAAKAGRNPAVMTSFATAAYSIGKIAEARAVLQNIPSESASPAAPARRLYPGYCVPRQEYHRR